MFRKYVKHFCCASKELTKASEDFALMLASYGIVRVIQEFPKMKLVSREDTPEAATDRHNLAITMSSADGCKVILG